MAEYLAPGVFIEEVDLRAPSIEAVSTSTTGMVGFTRRGPTVGAPTLVTNPLQFRENFGGPFAAGAFPGVDELYYAMQGFFANGGQRLYVVRAAGAGTTAAAATKGGCITRLAPGADAATGQKTIKVASLRGLTDKTPVTLQMTVDGVTYQSDANEIAVGGVDRATSVVTLKNLINIKPATGPQSFLAKATAVITTVNDVDAAGKPAVGARNPSLAIKAKDTGSWGSGIVLTSAPQTAARGEYVGMVADPGLQLVLKAPAAGFYVNAWVEIDRGSAEKIYRKVTGVSGNVLTLSGPNLTDATVKPLGALPTAISSCEFSLTAAYDRTVERYDGLTLENVPGRSVVEQLKVSRLIALTTPPPPAATNPFYFPVGDDGVTLSFTTAGVDAQPSAADIIGVDNGPGKRSGLASLEDIDDISIIAVPGWSDVGVQGAMIGQCERLKYRFAILDPATAASIPTVITQRLQFDTKYAALYYPRLIVRDTDGNPRPLGPSGHMAGLYARIDNERGVFKAPANEVVRNIVDLEALVSKGEHQVLNPEPNNINVFRDFRHEGRGLRIYGARCLTSASDWKYIPVRRLFIFLERSLDVGTQWAVFEPNDARLWAKLRDSVSAFLTRQWLDGALMGATKQQAFYVDVGPNTMTQDDIDNGRLIMEIGVAPVKPAEFVILRIGQWTGGTFVDEL